MDEGGERHALDDPTGGIDRRGLDLDPETFEVAMPPLGALTNQGADDGRDLTLPTPSGSSEAFCQSIERGTGQGSQARQDRGFKCSLRVQLGV